MRGKIFICINGLFLLLGMLAGCGDNVREDVPTQEQRQEEKRAERRVERQIEEHSFEIELDGWGRVVFAPFMQEDDSAQENRDVQFKLMRDEKDVYTFPARYEDNILHGQVCDGVAAVSFYDYDEDGRKDILLLIRYAGKDSGKGSIYYEPRLYTQEESGTDFYVDMCPTEYLYDYRENIADMKKGLSEYARKYQMVTENSAWEVERFAKRVKRLILVGDYAGLAENMVFPVRIDGTIYINKAAYMKAEFVTNPRPEFLEALKAEPCEDLFCNYSGIMIGDGLCWILDEGDSQGLKVYAVNGITPKNE